jgi:hypothetical protein
MFAWRMILKPRRRLIHYQIFTPERNYAFGGKKADPRIGKADADFSNMFEKKNNTGDL